MQWKKNTVWVTEPKYKKFMKSYNVFNAGQIDNLPQKILAKAKEVKENTALEKLPQLETFVKIIHVKNLSWRGMHMLQGKG